MKKLIFIGVMGLFVLGSCNSKNTGHEGHDHETVTHNHDEHEGHDHEAEGHDHEARLKKEDEEHGDVDERAVVRGEGDEKCVRIGKECDDEIEDVHQKS